MSIKYPMIPAKTEPLMIPNFAWLSRTGPNSGRLAYDRLAIKRDTVNPIPPSMEIPSKLLLFMWSGIFRKPLFTDNQVKENIPISLPKIKEIKIVRVTPFKSVRLMCSKEMLALAKANRGITT